VERLTFLEHKLNGTSESAIPESDDDINACPPSLELALFQDEKVLETMSREYIHRLLSTILERLKMKNSQQDF
jgi:hypothetical protein